MMASGHLFKDIDDAFAALRREQSIVSEFRGDYLDAAVWAETLLAQLIAAILTETSSVRREALLWDVLHHRSVSFGAKVEMLIAIAERLKDGELSEFASGLKTVLDRRNILAHSFWEQASPDKVTMRRFHGGQERLETITKATMKAWRSEADVLEGRLTMRLLQETAIEPNAEPDG